MEPRMEPVQLIFYFVSIRWHHATPTFLPFLDLYKILRSQRIQILTEDSERKFLSKRELIRFFEKDCQRQNVAAVAFVLFPREGLCLASKRGG